MFQIANKVDVDRAIPILIVILGPLNTLISDSAASEFEFMPCKMGIKVIGGSMTKVTFSMTKEELHHFHLVNILLVKS